jgi:hypothetical protein
MIHWMRNAPEEVWEKERLNFRVKAECSACGKKSVHKLYCDSGATTSAVVALTKLGWLSFDVDIRHERRLKTVGVCPKCVEKVPWLREAVGQE